MRGRKQGWAKEDANHSVDLNTPTPRERRGRKQVWAEEKARLYCEPNTFQLTPPVGLELKCLSELL